jgi:hypothetical protein
MCKIPSGPFNDLNESYTSSDLIGIIVHFVSQPGCIHTQAEKPIRFVIPVTPGFQIIIDI